MLKPIQIYSPHRSERLKYVLDWLFNEQLKTGYELVADPAAAFIVYGSPYEKGISISNAGLLFEDGIHRQNIAVGIWEDVPSLFAANDNTCTIPFDIFSALFFLLSRYEEYHAYVPDKHGRYPAKDSILYKQGFLLRPLVDEWVHRLRTLLRQHNILVEAAQFSFQPTYDIDIAWSYLHKGFVRSAGAFLKDVFKSNWGTISGRLRALEHKQKDPYDSFDLLHKLHTGHKLYPLYFILAAEKTTAFDKNISPSHPALQQLVRSLSSDGTIGVHPSYYTDVHPELIAREITVLKKITSKDISISRQHYIKLSLPQTYRNLITQGIEADYSIGYGTHIGFRAGTGQSFLWYDLEAEETTTLRLHPFCFMDTTALYEHNWDAPTAFRQLEILTEKLRHTNSRLVTVFHNFSLGTAAEWQGWKERYKDFVARIIS